MGELNVGRRERVIHSTVINKIESDIKKKIRDYMKLVRENEISKTQVKICKYFFLQLDILITEYNNAV